MKKFYLLLLIIFAFMLHGCRKSVSKNSKRETVEVLNNKGHLQRSNNSEDIHKSKIINKRTSQKLEGAEVFEVYNTAVFMIYTSDGINAYQGSGFFIDNEGLAVSNYHVFKGTNIGSEQIKLVDSDFAYNIIEVIAKSEKEDFILFKVNCSGTNYLPIAKTKPSIGEKVFAIGSPRGLENTFSSGEVSQWRGTNLMQISALIDHGSSGGVLINEYGEAVGITSGTFYDGSQANLNYAWSIDVIKPYINFR